MEQRIIKFRAWNPFNNIMVKEPYCFELVKEYLMNSTKHADDHPQYQYYEDKQAVENGIHKPCILMQFTGLKDKMGSEIYEGDIVQFYYKNPNALKAKNVTCTIVYANGMFCLQWKDGYINNHPLNSERYIVIGNIYEHPHLLREG